MKIMLLRMLMPVLIFSVSVCAANADDLTNGKTIEISMESSGRLHVGNIEGYKIIGIGSFNIRVPYKKTSTLVIKNNSTESIVISVKTDPTNRQLIITDTQSHSGNCSCNVPKVQMGLTLGDASCGVGYGAVAQISLE